MPTPIHVERTDNRFYLSPVVDSKIEAGWQALQARDSRVFNGTMLRVLGTVSDTASAVSVTTDIGYREVVGARSYPDFLEWIPETEQFQVLSAIAFIETSDGVLLLRDRSTGDWERSIELAGGFITAKNTPATVEEYIAQRIADDLSMPLEVVAKVETIGHIDFKSICESMFVCKVTLAIPFAAIAQDPIQFFPIPEGYTPATHKEYFSLPLHMPSGVVLEQYLSRVLASSSTND